MDNHFLNFRVQGFKCFEDLKLENLGLVNLIVGDNNVGKTSLLEALLFTEERHFETIRERWLNILQDLRGLIGIETTYLTYYVNRNMEDWEEFSEMRFEYGLANQEQRSIGISTKDMQNFPIEIDGKNGGSLSSSNEDALFFATEMPYAHFRLAYGKDLYTKYNKLQLKDKMRDRLIKALRALIPNITHIEPANGGLSLIIRREGAPTLPLASFGEGAVKLFRLLMEIIEWSKQRLMIDEIETGIHHSRLVPFWQAILDTANAQNTQIFATTHSLECLQKFHEVLEKPENEALREKVRIIRLAQTAKKGIQAYIFPYENFEYSIENDIEVR